MNKSLIAKVGIALTVVGLIAYGIFVDRTTAGNMLSDLA